MQRLLLTTLLVFVTSLVLSAQIKVDALQDSDVPLYGPFRSVGVSIIGTGVVGMPLRFIVKKGNQIEVVPELSGRATVDESSLGIHLGIGYNVLLGHNLNKRKGKVIKNYVGAKAGILAVRNPLGTQGVVWHREVFRFGEQSYSRSMDLGFLYSYSFDGTGNPNVGGLGNQIRLFIRVDWNWYKK